MGAAAGTGEADSGSSQRLCALVVVGLLVAVLAALLVPCPVPGHLDNQDAVAAPDAEHLNAQYQRLVRLGYGAADFRRALQEVLPSLPAKRRLPSGAPYFVKQYAKLAMAQLPTKLQLPCGWDASLPLPPHGTRVFVASNQRNSAAVMPNFITQLLSLAVVLPPGSMHVSIYESASSDSTPQWLQFLQLMLQGLDVPSNIVSNGTLVRKDNDDRIGFLAGVRNAALKPLERLQAEAAAHRMSEQRRSRWATAMGRPPPAHAEPFVPDRLVFINDVYFCAADVVRLLAHRADLMCGLDTSRTFTQSAWGQRTMALPLEFYDYWVARDVAGRRLHRYPPYIKHEPTAERLRQGLPTPVGCCWNGLAVLRAEPFLAGLRFRNRTSVRECDASECSLMCDDLRRLGYADVAVDPGVRVAYEFSLARDMAAGLVQESRLLPWSAVAAAPHRSSLQLPPVRHTECCSKAGPWDVNFDNCQLVDIFEHNFTAQAMGLA